MERLPAEVAEVVIQHLSKNERLELRRVCHRLNSLVIPRLPILWAPERAHFGVMRLQKLPGTLHISFPAVDPPMAQHLVPLSEKATRTWKRWSGEKIDCFSTFSFPCSGKFALFEKATIDHLEIAQLLPLYIEDGNLQQLQRLLRGCAVDRTTLVFDHQTLRNLHTIPAFLRSISCRSVEFILEKTAEFDMLAPFTNARFASSLVAAGVREVVLTGVHAWGREQPRDPPRRVQWKSYEQLASRVLSALFKAGIRSIEVGQHTLRRDVITMSREELDALIDTLTPLPRPLRLRLYLYVPINNVPGGRYARADDEEQRRSVQVEIGDNSFYHRNAWGQRITIELGAEESI